MPHNADETTFANWLLCEDGPSSDAHAPLTRLTDQLRGFQNGEAQGVETLADLRALEERIASDLDGELFDLLWGQYLDWKTANEIEADEVSLGAELLLDEGERPTDHR